MKYLILFFLLTNARANLANKTYDEVWDVEFMITREYCQIDTIETNGQSPWCNKHRYTDSLEYCYCMKDDPEYSWSFPWEK